MQTDIDFSRFAAVFFETDPKKSFKQPKSKSATTETFLIPAPVPDQVPDIAQRLENTDDFEYIAFGFLEQLEERSSCQPTLTSSSSECNGSISGVEDFETPPPATDGLFDALLEIVDSAQIPAGQELPQQILMLGDPTRAGSETRTEAGSPVVREPEQRRDPVDMPKRIGQRTKNKSDGIVKRNKSEQDPGMLSRPCVGECFEFAP